MIDRKKKYILNYTNESVHTGQLLLKYYQLHRTHKSALARRLNRKPETIYKYQKNASIQTAILWEISTVLKHNFFLDIACLLPKDYSTYAPIEVDQSNKITELELQVKLLSAERDVLLKALGQK